MSPCKNKTTSKVEFNDTVNNIEAHLRSSNSPHVVNYTNIVQLSIDYVCTCNDDSQISLDDMLFRPHNLDMLIVKAHHYPVARLGLGYIGVQQFAAKDMKIFQGSME